ncbi:apolipoprotein N-acyltransferase [Mucilaginibacter calamicampi]|uniref:Apolipoprotein N-acyltransferase n=1 Tax=Mucilaginibacter calamicampi TaxID=1302352 RepID=A0ABW2YTD3_9SPHI
MKKNILLSVFSGLLLWLAWPPMHYTTFFLFFGMVPMLIAVENIIKSTSTKKGTKIFELTFLGFFVWNTFSIYWVYNSIKFVGELVAVPISLIPYSLGPLLMASAFWLYYRFRLATNRSKGLIALVCFWIAYEYLHQSWDLAFPWMTLGNGFAATHQWVQWYEYTGVYGGTIWIWVINILIFLIYIGFTEAQLKQTRLKLSAFLLAFLTLPLIFSLYKYNNYKEQADPSNIVVVQPNIDPYYKNGYINTSQQIQILTHLSDSVGQVNTEYFIWPETAIPDSPGIDEDQIRTHPDYRQVLQFLSKYRNGNVITGAETRKYFRGTDDDIAEPGAGDRIENYNTAVNIENSAQVQFYHKSKLVPGVESLPFGNALSFLKPVFEHIGGAVGSYVGQENAGVLYAQSGIGAAPVICYESIWGEWVAGAVRDGAQFIAIITNDGWWENTSGKDQHLDYAKLRAIETRRWVARSANTGISAFINQRGDIVQQSKWWVRAALKQDINLNSDLTFYVKHGDYLPKIGSFLAVLGIIFIGIKMRLRRKEKTVAVH